MVTFRTAEAWVDFIAASFFAGGIAASPNSWEVLVVVGFYTDVFAEIICLYSSLFSSLQMHSPFFLVFVAVVVLLVFDVARVCRASDSSDGASSGGSIRSNLLLLLLLLLALLSLFVSLWFSSSL